ncbi:MAG: FtsH protease activity modulator HflK [Pseudobacteriovorax sp.]|nr:FtsH protease activity modulator HflK [Pseudobacteriovorax sp.]
MSEFDDYANKVRDIFSGKKGKPNGSGPGGGFPQSNNTIFYIVGVFFLLLSAFKGFYTVEADEEAVVTRFGEYIKTNQPGLHFKIPWVDETYKVKSKKRQEEVFGFVASTRASVTAESLMLTGDLNLADVEWIVQYEISDPAKFLFQAQNVKKAIRDVSMSVMRRVVGDRLVGEVLTTGRTEIALEVKELMQETINKYDLGILLQTVALQSVTPPDPVKPAFNDVNTAMQEQEQAINAAEREYNRVIPEARGKAEQLLADAEAYAIDTINRAKGNAERFSNVLTEYKKAPSITRKRLYIEAMEEILEQTDGFVLVDEGAKGLMPIYGRLQTEAK